MEHVTFWNRIRCRMGKHRWELIRVDEESGRRCRVCGRREFGGAEGYTEEGAAKATSSGWPTGGTF